MSRKSMFGIKGKLVLLVAFAFTCFGGLAGYSFYAESKLTSLSERLATKRLPMAKLMAEMRVGHQGSVRYLWLAAAYPPGSDDRKNAIEKVDSYSEMLEKGMKEFGPFLQTAEGRKLFSEMKATLSKVNTIVAENRELLAEGSREADERARELRLSKMPPLAQAFSKEIEALSENMEGVNREILAETQDIAAQSKVTLITVTLLAGLLLLTVGYVFATRLSKQLMALTESVSQAGVQVSAASEQLSQTSSTLSTSSQEQASSLEETAAALTEISGMVEANTKGAEQARDYAKEVHTISEQTRKSMEELSSAMSLILESNVRIEKIVKVIEEIGDKTEVIDEIVFKTQLLSFNASVEAERAGEHGRGFAVVAQEVGNLAQMSGKAATEIAEIVRNSIREAEQVAVENKTRVEKGSHLASSTQEKMTAVLEKASMILDSTSRIAAASHEQNQGINQITSGVDSLNHTTQETASTAEESASASEELASQAAALMGLVNDLRFIVTGQADGTSHPTHSQPHHETGSFAANVTPIHTKQTRGNRSRALSPKTVAKAPIAVNGTSVSSSDDAWEKL